MFWKRSSGELREDNWNSSPDGLAGPKLGSRAKIKPFSTARIDPTHDMRAVMGDASGSARHVDERQGVLTISTLVHQWQELSEGVLGRSRGSVLRRGSHVAAGHTALFQIALMVVFGDPERRCGNDLSNNRLFELATLCEDLLGLFSELLLLFIVIEDH